MHKYAYKFGFKLRSMESEIGKPLLRFLSKMSASNTQAPAGLKGDLIKVSSGGDDAWRLCQPLKVFTNVFIYEHHKGRVRPSAY